MISNFSKAFEDAKAHARQEYPLESCGLIVSGKYIACENVADPVDIHNSEDKNCTCQLCSFVIAPDTFAKHMIDGTIDMVIHSHPNGPYFPSKADMECQMTGSVPWAIIVLDAERIGSPIIWGDQAPIPNVIGREFMHGVTDCYSLVRDCFRLGKDELAAQDIKDWPFTPVKLLDLPRNDSWWNDGEDLYEKNFLRAGFVRIDASEAKPGDVFLMKIRSQTSNHAGVLVSSDLILHHLPERLSRREPAGIWGRQATFWLRYVGVFDA